MTTWLNVEEITEVYRVTEETLMHYSVRGNLPALGLTSDNPRYSLSHLDQLFPKRSTPPAVQMVPPKLGTAQLGGMALRQRSKPTRNLGAHYYLAAS